jgi:hypothetical protein
MVAWKPGKIGTGILKTKPVEVLSAFSGGRPKK